MTSSYWHGAPTQIIRVSGSVARTGTGSKAVQFDDVSGDRNERSCLQGCWSWRWDLNS